MMIDIDHLVSTFRALGERSRLCILSELLAEPRHVGDLVRRTQLQQSLVSHHLKVLRNAGLVTANRRGPFIYYELAGRHVRKMLENGGPPTAPGADSTSKSGGAE